MKGLIKFVLVVIASAAVSVWANQTLWPRLAQQPALRDYGIQTPIPAVERQIIIQENAALKNAIDKVAKVLVLIKKTAVKGDVAAGAGLVLTSDGVAVALSDLLPQGAKFEISVGGKTAPFEIVKRDATLNLALMKIDADNLSTSSFYPLDNLRLGERVFLLGADSSGKNFVNEGVVRSFNADSIETTIIEKSAVKGSPVFDIEGNIIGLALFDKAGWVSVIPISKIKEFSGL